MADEFQYRRMPAVPVKISDINPEKNIRIRILGRIIDKSDGVIVVDDGSAKAEILNAETGADINDLVRVFARVLPLEDKYELHAEIVQDMAGLDLSLYKRVYG